MSLPPQPVVRAAYNNCKPEESLAVGDSRYVDFSERGVRGNDGDIVEELFDAVIISDQATHLLMSGFRGSGKTTELRRLEKKLQENDCPVIFVDVEDYLNLNVPATVSDLWITIAAGFDKFVEEKQKFRHGVERFWDRISAFLNREIEVSDVKLKGDVKGVVASGGMEFKLALKENPDFRTRLNDAVQARRPELVEECRRFTEEAVALLSGSGTKTIVAIIDSFEKLQGTSRNADEVRESAEALFVRDWNLLKSPSFHAIFTVPPWLAFIEAGTNDDLRMLSMCRITNRDGTKYDEGIAALYDMLRHRMNLEEIFGTPVLIEPLIEASGGYPRDLLRLIRGVLLRNVGVENLPIPEGKLNTDVERVINRLAEQYQNAMDGEDIKLLGRLARERDVLGWNKKEKLRVASLFDHHFVLSYQNGERWLDLHPLIRRSAAVQKALSASPEPAADGPAE